MIQSHRLYKYYVSYLTYKKSINVFSEGAFHLLKISESSFNDFLYDYENNLKFKSIVDDILISELRDGKIDDILNH